MLVDCFAIISLSLSSARVCSFSRPFSVSDIESVDLVFYNSLKYVLEEDPTPLDLTFTIQEQSFGEVSWCVFGQKFGGQLVAMVTKREEALSGARTVV